MQRYINIDEENEEDIKIFYDVAYIYIYREKIFFAKAFSFRQL